MADDRRGNPEGSHKRSHYPGTFLQAFREAAEAVGWKVAAWHDDHVEVIDPEGKTQTVGLENLYRRARRAEREEWPALITEFLTQVDTGQYEGLGETALADVADRLLVRLGRPFNVKGAEVRPWTKPLDDTGLALNLVIDFPRSMAYVNDNQIEKSGQPGDVWLARALDNLQARTAADGFHVLDEDSGLLLFQAGDSYDSSRALILDRLLPNAPGGFLVSVPHRDVLLVQPVEPKALPYLHLIKLGADKAFKNAPYAITDEIFWVHKGRWREFAVRFEDNNVVVTPPEEFIAILNDLIPDQGEGEDTPE
jgi:hypothetical protein